MKTDDDRLNKVFDKTRGKCHLCHKQLAFSNYGKVGAKGAWEIEHSKPRSKGGTDHMNNLYAAHIECNRKKSNGTNYSIRSKYGVKNAPLSHTARKNKMIKNVAGGAVTGAAIGRFLGPGGMVIGGLLGALVGSDIETDE